VQGRHNVKKLIVIVFGYIETNIQFVKISALLDGKESWVSVMSSAKAKHGQITLYVEYKDPTIRKSEWMRRGLTCSCSLCVATFSEFKDEMKVARMP